MKVKKIKLMSVILLSVMMQACSSNQPKVNYQKSELVSPLTTEKQLLADALGETSVNELYISNSTSVLLKSEYRITAEYTAASGRQCKEAQVIDVTDSNAEQAADVVCKGEMGHWYWPRKIILK